MRSKVLQSAAILVYINSRPFGVATSFKWTSSTPKKAFYGIDNPDPYELGVTTTKVSGTIGVYRTDGDGGGEGWGLTASFDELSREKYFSVMLIDRATQRVIFQADHCSTQSQSWSVPVRGVVTGEFVFEALTWSNEIRPLTA